MRRKTERDILKENTWLICASCVLIMLGILIGLGRKVSPFRWGRLRFLPPKIFLAFSPELYYTKWAPAGVMEW